MTMPTLLSVLVPVTREVPGIQASYALYRDSLRTLGCPVEFLFVVDGPVQQTLKALKALRRQGEPIRILAFGQAMGEAAALSVGFRSLEGDVILTLTAERQVDPAELPRLVTALDGGDMVVAVRTGERRQRLAGSGKLEVLLRVLLKSTFKDIRSGVRVMRSAVAAELNPYGNQQRFLPLLAQAQGFTVKELEVRAHAPAEPTGRGMRVDLSILLDVLTIYFLLRFIKKPFRFFGGFGFAVLAAGGLATLYLILVRLFFGTPLADRPALILSTLMVVLGIQIIAVGLIGEIITFAHARELKDYKVERVVE